MENICVDDKFLRSIGSESLCGPLFDVKGKKNIGESFYKYPVSVNKKRNAPVVQFILPYILIEIAVSSFFCMSAHTRLYERSYVNVCAPKQICTSTRTKKRANGNLEEKKMVKWPVIGDFGLLS